MEKEILRLLGEKDGEFFEGDVNGNIIILYSRIEELFSNFPEMIQKNMYELSDTTKKLIIDKYNILKKYNTSLISAYDEVEAKSANQNTELPDLTVDNINSFLDDLVKDLEKSTKNYQNYNQRNYDNLNNLYANKL